MLHTLRVDIGRVPRSVLATSRIAALCAALSPLVGLPSAARAETLSSAISQALETNASLKAEEQIVLSAQSSRDLSAAEYRPNVAGYTEVGRQRVDQLFTGFNQFSRETINPRGYGIQISQNLWDGFKTTRSVIRDDLNLESARAGLADYTQRLILEVVTAYVNVIRTRAVLAQYQSNAAALAARLNEMQARKVAGMALETDRQQARSYLSKAEADTLTAKANVQTAIARYRLIVGSEPENLIHPNLPVEALPQSLEEALDRARAEHPSIAAAEAAADASAADIDVARAGYLPTVDLVASAQHQADPALAPTIDEQNSYTAMLRMNMPIYTGGRVGASVDVSTHRATEKRLRLDYQRETITSAVISAWGQYTASGRILDAARAQARSARLALQGIEKGEGAGLRLATEYYEARRVLVEAEVFVATAECDRVIAAYTVLEAIGALSAETQMPVFPSDSAWVTSVIRNSIP